MTGTLAPDFRLGNLATDLVDYTIFLCNKDETKNPRFPQRMYSSYVMQMVNLALDIEEKIFAANESRNPEKRQECREVVLGKCCTLAKLAFIAYERGWISDRLSTAWQKKINAVYFLTLKWK